MTELELEHKLHLLILEEIIVQEEYNSIKNRIRADREVYEVQLHAEKEKIMPYSEEQPKSLGFCRHDDCGAELWDGDDVRFPEWLDGDPDCFHCLPNHSHGEDDSKAEMFTGFMEE